MAAKEDVNIKVSANVAEAIQMWKAMEAGPDGMAKALAGMGDKGEKATKGIGEQVLSWAGKWATAGTAIALVTKLINDQYEAVKRLREEKLAASTSVDEVWNQFQVQSGLQNGPRSDAVRTSLFQTIANRKAAPIPGMQSAVALGSAGASVEDITGGGLDEFLKMVTASNAAGKQVNQAELASSLVKFLKANNLSPNREGMQGSSMAIQQLFGGTNLQASNLSRFARDAGSIASMSHMAPEDQLAQFSMLLDTMSEDTASTAFKSGVISLATSGGNRDKMRGLTMLGLKPGDVDFQGENWQDVYGRLNKGFGSVAPEKRNIAAKLLFGDEGLPFYTTFLEDGDLTEAQKRGGMARSTEGAAARLKTAEGSMAAASRQAETQATASLYDPKAIDPKTIRDRLVAMSKLYGLNEGFTAEVLKEYDDPLGPDWMYDMTPEGRAKRSSERMYGSISFTGGLNRIDREAGRWVPVKEGPGFLEEQLRGDKPIRIQLTDPGGLAIPHEPAAVDLNAAPEQVQRMLGR